jgi:hypothetical protein
MPTKGKRPVVSDKRLRSAGLSPAVRHNFCYFKSDANFEGRAMTDDTKRLTLRCQFCDTWNRIDAARAGDRPKCGNCGHDSPRPPVDTDRRVVRSNDCGNGRSVLVDFYAGAAPARSWLRSWTSLRHPGRDERSWPN